MRKPFVSVEALHPGRTAFDRSHSNTFTCDMGQLIPFYLDSLVPGDKFKIGIEAVIRFQPLVAPILHQIDMIAEYYFVPYRLLFDGWEDFITGGIDGEDSTVLPRLNPSLCAGPASNVGQLWDYFGFPAGVLPDANHCPLAFPWMAYYFIWNEYFRDETLQDPIAFDLASILADHPGSYNPLNVSWPPDYYTKSLPFQQRGTAPSLPISGMTSAVFPDDVQIMSQDAVKALLGQEAYSTTNVGHDGLATFPVPGVDVGYPIVAPANSIAGSNYLNNNTVDLSLATTFNIADLRLAFQIQKWLERNARSGVRYTEFLHAHFGVSPRDERLQRPEFVGGTKCAVIVSEVLKTSSTDGTSPQGNMAGHGISAHQDYCGKYFATEFGLIMGLMRVVPKPMYSQGINRQWLYTSKYDFYFREFANLSEQAVEQCEIYCNGVEADNATIFGYEGRYDELRYHPSQVSGLMRPDVPDNLSFWNLSRYFSGAPSLNSDFITCVPDKRIFADEEAPGLIVSIGNLITAIRPIPISGEPGLIDHH